MPPGRTHNMEHHVYSAAQQLGNLFTQPVQKPSMCIDDKRAQWRLSGALGPMDSRFNSYSTVHDHFMPWPTQRPIMASYPVQLQALQSQRVATISTYTREPLPKQLKGNCMPKSQHDRHLGTDPSCRKINIDPFSVLGYSTMTTESPVLENQAAHALTTLRSRQDRAQPFTDTCTTSLLCQQQACSKNDCPSSSQVICPAEEIEARFCDGNCVGSLCIGVGCPYNVDPYGYHGFDHGDCSDFWACQWACDLETCNITSSDNENNPDYVEYGQRDGQNNQECLTALVGRNPHEVLRTNPTERQDDTEVHCSLDEFTALMDADEASIDWRFQSCHNQPHISERHWKNSQVADTTNGNINRHLHSKQRPGSSHSDSNLRSSSSTDVSASSSPTLVQLLEANTDGYTCMWVMDQASGQICGFTCGWGNNMQAHIEANHIEPQLSGGESGRRKSAIKIPRSLTCKWNNCKHNLQKKVLRSTQALRQHTFTHSGC